MTHAAGHPLRRRGQSLAAHQKEMAQWMGYANAEQMNAEHDPLHAQLSNWVGVTSFSLLDAQGVPLDRKERRLAELEEAAVIHLQRWLANLRQEGELICSVVF